MVVGSRDGEQRMMARAIILCSHLIDASRGAALDPLLDGEQAEAKH